MTKTEIENRLKELSSNRDEWNKLQNEGHSDGYNPIEDEISRLSDKLIEIVDGEKVSEWTREVTNDRRNWFNSQKFTNPLEALNGCREKGFEFSDLQKFTKIFPSK